MKTSLNHTITVDLQLSEEEADWLLDYLEHYPENQELIHKNHNYQNRFAELRTEMRIVLDQIKKLKNKACEE